MSGFLVASWGCTIPHQLPESTLGSQEATDSLASPAYERSEMGTPRMPKAGPSPTAQLHGRRDALGMLLPLASCSLFRP